MKRQSDNIESFILNEELTVIAQQNDLVALKAFIVAHPGREEEIMQAFLLLKNLKVNSVPVQHEQITKDYQQLMHHIKRRKKRAISLWLSVGAAACVCMIFTLSTLFSPSPIEKDTLNLFSLLDSITADTEEIQIVSGNISAQVFNNETITQTREGSVVVGEEEKIKSEDLQTEYVQVVVPNGRRTSVRFHDGTLAWLNSGTKLVYPKIFATDKREIFVEGEIFLDVQKSTDRAFVVHAKAFDVEVFGTTFNVSAYSEDSENSVVLVDGSVGVTSSTLRQVLTPNQGCFISNGSVRVKVVDTYTYTCWKDGIMKIDGEPLSNMFNRLARHYNIKINHDGQQLFSEKYKGKLNLHDSIEEVLTNLSISIPFTFKREEDNTISVHVKRNNNK